MQKVFHKNELPEIAKLVLKQLSTFDFSLSTGRKAQVLALSGDLGAGKTALTQEIAKALGVIENVISPTYVIMKSYKLSVMSYKFLIHIDAYRLESSKELEKLGWQEIISDPKNLILVEWPERVTSLIPHEAIRIHLGHVDEEKRAIEVDW